jgi:ATP-dependent RNA helicase CshB
VYCKNDDNKIAKLIKKGIKINYSLVTQNEFISKPLQLRLRKKIVFDKETNSEIQKVIRNNKSTKRVKPCYKKKIKSQILKIKQKKKHEHIDKIIKAKFREKLRDKAKNKQ